MRGCFVIFLIVCICVQVSAQDYCKHKPLKFKEFFSDLNSDQGGFYPTADIVQRKNLQLESNLAFSILNSSYTQTFASASQVRYGLSSKFEIKLGYAYVSPQEIEADLGTHSQIMAGIKLKIISVQRRNVIWKSALAGSYFIENLNSENSIFSGGYFAAIINSLKFYKLINLDTMIAYLQNLNRNSVKGLLNTQLLIKSDKSRAGFFLGIGGMYIKSYVNLGVLITNNNNYMMHFSFMTLDNDTALNACLSVKFGK